MVSFERQPGTLVPRYAWAVAVVVAFSLVLLSTATWTDLDGDDATSFAYHALGRNEELQEPYKAYHSMMDALLSIFPSDPALIRSIGLWLTKAGTLATVILMLALSFQWLNNPGTRQRLLIAAFALILSPELYYLGLIYSPTMPGLALILASHLLLRRTVQWRSAGLLASIFLFALGASIRWSLLSYGLVIAADLLIMKRQRGAGTANGLAWAAGWGLGALALTLGLIVLSGYSPAEIASALRVVEEVATQHGVVYGETVQISLETVLTLLPLLTPAFVVCCLAGLIHLLYQRDPRLLPVAAGVAAGLPWIGSGVPKFLIVMIPGLIFCAAQGTLLLWEYGRAWRSKRLLRGAFLAVALAPWFVGISVAREGTRWGPGFEMRDYDSPEMESGFSLLLDAGTAYPTPEYVRPLGGHFFVLLGGEWGAFNERRSLEQEEVMAAALEHGLPLVVLCWSPDFFVNRLIEQGYSTDDADDAAWAENEHFVARRFEKPDAAPVTLVYQEMSGDLEAEQARDLLSLEALGPQVVVYGYSQTMIDIYERAPEALQKIGGRSAIVDLRLLAQAGSEQRASARADARSDR